MLCFSRRFGHSGATLRCERPLGYNIDGTDKATPYGDMIYYRRGGNIEKGIRCFVPGEVVSPHLPRFPCESRQVICRIRPPTAEEKSAGVPIALEALGDGEVGVKTFRDVMAGRNGSSGGVGSWRSFTLDKAFGPSTSQEDVFRQVNGRLEMACVASWRRVV